jgi:hypothetical protein
MPVLKGFSIEDLRKTVNPNGDSAAIIRANSDNDYFLNVLLVELIARIEALTNQNGISKSND